MGGRNFWKGKKIIYDWKLGSISTIINKNNVKKKFISKTQSINKTNFTRGHKMLDLPPPHIKTCLFSNAIKNIISQKVRLRERKRESCINSHSIYQGIHSRFINMISALSTHSHTKNPRNTTRVSQKPKHKICLHNCINHGLLNICKDPI